MDNLFLHRGASYVNPRNGSIIYAENLQEELVLGQLNYVESLVVREKEKNEALVDANDRMVKRNQELQRRLSNMELDLQVARNKNRLRNLPIGTIAVYSC